ncbi:hypothetical protein [Kitasatospora albolonga]|uniref:hypothetical protein n=1 Tax=Kitasatospora albolonga TaxID=68173 RepID=UPI0031ED19C2
MGLRAREAGEVRRAVGGAGQGVHHRDGGRGLGGRQASAPPHFEAQRAAARGQRAAHGDVREGGQALGGDHGGVGDPGIGQQHCHRWMLSRCGRRSGGRRGERPAGERAEPAGGVGGHRFQHRREGGEQPLAGGPVQGVGVVLDQAARLGPVLDQQSEAELGQTELDVDGLGGEPPAAAAGRPAGPGRR